MLTMSSIRFLGRVDALLGFQALHVNTSSLCGQAERERESPNFMPFFCQEQRMRFARMAIGEVAVSDPCDEQMLLQESEIHRQADDDVNVSETEPIPAPNHAPDTPSHALDSSAPR